MSDIRQKILRERDERIEKYGWTVVAVLPSHDQASYAYSVAFEQTFNHPEVLMVGFDPNLSQQIIAGVADGLKSRSLYLPPKGGRAAQVIQDMDVLIRPVPEPKASQIAKGAAKHVAPKPLRLLQICLPDAEGRLPDDPACDARFRELQDFEALESHS